MEGNLKVATYAVGAVVLAAVAVFGFAGNLHHDRGHAASQAADPVNADAAQPRYIVLRAPLSGNNEVPRVKSSATGRLDLSYDTQTRRLSWKGTYRALTGRAMRAGIFGPGQEGQNAAIQFPVIPFSSPFAGSTTLSEAQEHYLLTGALYFNLRSSSHSNGEIRGQILRVQ